MEGTNITYPMRSIWSAIRGPILLITLGSLFAMDHMGMYAFSRTWPVLLIVIGVLKLMERATSPRTI